MVYDDDERTIISTAQAQAGERETEALINFVDVKAKENKQEIQESNLKTLATKEDLWSVKEELKGDITSLKTDIAKLDTKISDVRSDVTRWMLAIFITIVLTALGLFFKH